MLDRAAGAESARGWRDLAERALVAFGGNPLPQGRGGGGGGGWWGGLQPLTPGERAMANVSRGGWGWDGAHLIFVALCVVVCVRAAGSQDVLLCA